MFMMKIRLLSFFVLIQIIWIGSVDAQSIVVDRMSSTEEVAYLTKNTALDKQLRFGIDLGYSRRNGKAVDEIPDDFVRKMRTGINFGADLIYFPVEVWGVGMKFSGRTFNAQTNGAIKLIDRTQMYYFAPIVVARAFDKRNRNAWVFGVSAGYLRFIVNVDTPYYHNSVSKSTLGTTWEIGYDMRISKKCFFGPKLTFTSGSILFEDYNGEMAKESASSTDLSLGLRF